MIFSQYYLDCLSQASYLIGDDTSGRAIVVDPRRDAAQYIADAEAAGLTIEMVLETHFHADFVSGHLELAAATGASIGFSSVATTDFESVALDHGTVIDLGEVRVEIRHTPGHTPESMSIVVWERQDDDAPYAVLTGDTLFVGDVGRPDLLSSVGRSSDELAAMLYASIHEQLLTLPDTTRVYPAHGAGSACGKNLSSDTWSTIGEQRATNYALQAPDAATFIELVTSGQTSPPAYFAVDAVINRSDHQLLDEAAAPTPLNASDVERLAQDGTIILDGRTPERFADGHLSGSINIGLAGRYAEFAGSVIPHTADVVLVTEPGDEIEAKNRLGRIGFDRVVGALDDVDTTISTDSQLCDRARRVSADELDAPAHGDDLQLLDIRNPGETSLGVIDGAVAIPLGQLRQRIDELDASAPTIVYCAGGYRSSVGASLLRHLGFTDVSDLTGGYGAWLEHRHATSTID